MTMDLIEGYLQGLPGPPEILSFRLERQEMFVPKRFWVPQTVQPPGTILPEQWSSSFAPIG